MTIKEAIEQGDAAALGALLEEEPANANELIVWGINRAHPLHYVSDMLAEGKLERGKTVALVEELLKAGADVNYQAPNGETALIGAASLGAEEVGLRLLEAGAQVEAKGIFGATALHWAAMLGMSALVAELLKKSADPRLEDTRYQATALGWARHGMENPPPYHQGQYREVVELLERA